MVLVLERGTPSLGRAVPDVPAQPRRGVVFGVRLGPHHLRAVGGAVRTIDHVVFGDVQRVLVDRQPAPTHARIRPLHRPILARRIDQASRLEEQHLHARRGELVRGHAAGGAGADDDDVVGRPAGDDGGRFAARDLLLVGDDAVVVARLRLLLDHVGFPHPAIILLCSRGPTLARAAGALFRGRVSVLRMGAADELAQELVALIGQLAVDADLRGVVAADGLGTGDLEELS